MSESTVRVMFVRDSSPLAGVEVRLDDGSVKRTDDDGIVTVPAVDSHVDLCVKDVDDWHTHRLATGRPGGLVVLDVHRSRTTAGMLDTSRIDLGERYRYVSLLGRGGMGVVIRAEDTVLDRPVAIKMLTSELQENPEAREILLTEGKALARLSHPNLVKIFDVAQLDGRVIVVLEFIEGTSLQSFVRPDNPMSARHVVDLSAQLVDALAYLHGEGVIHRDIKPANMIRQPDGVLRLIDFGLARSVEHLVQRGTRVRGSPAYMAPEQVEGRELTRATDVYQFGVTLFELLSGRLPFTSGDFAYAHVHRQPPSLDELRPELDSNLTLLVNQCLAKPPQARPTFDEVRKTLRGLQRAGPERTTAGDPLALEPLTIDLPQKRRRWLPLAAVAGSVIVALSLVWGFSASTPPAPEPASETNDAPASNLAPAPRAEPAFAPATALSDARASVQLAARLAATIAKDAPQGEPVAQPRPRQARPRPIQVAPAETMEPSVLIAQPEIAQPEPAEVPAVSLPAPEPAPEVEPASQPATEPRTSVTKPVEKKKPTAVSKEKEAKAAKAAEPRPKASEPAGKKKPPDVPFGF